MRNTARSAGSALVPVARVGASVAAGISLIGPAVTGLVAAGHGVAAFGGALANMAPAAAELPAMAASFALVKGTIVMAAPAMEKAVTPVTNAFRKMQPEIGRLATKDLPGLSRGFVRVNMPQIRTAMDSIAKSTNGIVKETGKWVNSSEGQKVIGGITKSTSREFAILSPHISAAAIAVGRLTGRGSEFAAQDLAGVIGKIADKIKSLADNTSKADIMKAFGDIGNLVQKFKDWGNALRDVGHWMGENTGKVKALSDVFAVLGVTLGLLTGNYIGAAIAGFSLLVNHWDEVKAAFSSPIVKNAFTGISASIQPLVSWFTDSLMPAMRDTANAIMPSLTRSGAAISAAFRDNKDVIASVQGAFRVLGVIITNVVVPALGAIVAALIGTLGPALRGIGVILRSVVIPVIRGMTETFLNMVGNIIGGAARAFAWVPGLGPKLAAAARSFEGFAANVRAAINDLPTTKTFTYTVKVNGQTSVLRDSGAALGVSYTGSSGHVVRARARGGPVAAGTGYVVGEHGPEFFSPSTSGRITPPGAVSTSSGPAVVVHVHNAVVGGAEQIARAVTEALDRSSLRGLRTARA